MKFVYHGHHDGEKVRVHPGILDAHRRPLVNPYIMPADTPNAPAESFVIEAGRPFLIDHTDHERGLNWVADFMASHAEFKLLSRDALPPKPANPRARATMGATRAGENNG